MHAGDMLIALHNRQAAADYRLSPSAKMALAVIEGAGGPLEPSVIAERLLVTTGSMTSTLDTLEKRRLVTRMPHPSDRRKLLIEVTPAAIEILNQLLPSIHQRERRVMSRALTKAEQRELLRLVAKIQAAARVDAGEPPIRDAKRKRPHRLER